MMFQLLWSPKSPFVRKVMVCAHELGVADRIELIPVVAAMLAPNPAIMQHNPLSKIPALTRDDGPPLVESSLICEYLDTRFAGGLLPAAGEPRWQVLRWQALATGWMEILVLWRNERDRPDTGPLEAMVEAFATKNLAALDLFEQELAALEAQPFGMAQVCLGCALGYLDFRFEAVGWRERAPGLARWYQAVAARPSFVATAPKFN